MKKPFYLLLKKRFFNAFALLVVLSSLAALCDEDDVSFTVSKELDDSYEVNLTANDIGTSEGTLSKTIEGSIDLKESEEFQEYKDDMEVTEVNKIYAKISPADGETSIIGTAEVEKLEMRFSTSTGETLTKTLPDTPITLTALEAKGEIEIRDLFTESEIDTIISTFNNAPTLDYFIEFVVTGAAPVKFKVTYFFDVSARVTPL